MQADEEGTKVRKRCVRRKGLGVHIDMEKFPSLGARFDVSGLPTILLFKKGLPIHRIEGMKKANEIIREVQEFL